MTKPDKTLPIDHIVLSLPDLEQARNRFTALGFSVSPVANHEFGTQNAIIAFSNGTFLEPLAIGDSRKVEIFIRKRNAFLLREEAFRFRHTNLENNSFDGGISMVAFAGRDVKKIRKKFKKAGLGAHKFVKVRRPRVDVRIAFAIDEHANDCSLFVCERKNGLTKFNTELCLHANGAIGISRITLFDENPADFLNYIVNVCTPQKIEHAKNSIAIQLPNAQISVLNAEALQSEYGIEITPGEVRAGLRAITYDIGVTSLDETAMMLAERGIDARRVGERIVVANSAGQGAVMAFVEEKSG